MERYCEIEGQINISLKDPLESRDYRNREQKEAMNSGGTIKKLVNTNKKRIQDSKRSEYFISNIIIASIVRLITIQSHKFITTR